jgi:hypothetical protein
LLAVDAPSRPEARDEACPLCLPDALSVVASNGQTVSLARAT